MNEKMTLIEILKKKGLQMAGLSVVLTFVAVTVIDVFLNWLINKDIQQNGVVMMQYNITISFLSPAFFIIIFVAVVALTFWKMNRPQKLVGQEQKARPEYYGNYTWEDIFKDRQFFGLFAGLSLSIFLILYMLMQYISENSGNFAFAVMAETSFGAIAIVSAFLGINLALFWNNVVYTWFSRTEKGNKVVNVVVMVCGCITAYVTSGIGYFFQDSDSAMEDLSTDLLLGELIPIDLTTTIWTLITFLMWHTAKKGKWANKQLINRGLFIAVICFIFSLTPLQTGLHLFIVSFVEAFHGM